VLAPGYISHLELVWEHPSYERFIRRLASFARGIPTDEYPWAIVPEAWELYIQEDEEETWGQGFSLMNLATSQFEDEAIVRGWGRFERQSMSPRMVREAIRLMMQYDIRDVVPSIRVPTLVIHRSDDVVPVEGGRWLAQQVPGALAGEELLDLFDDVVWV
jgi:pimeloyl-ACP methyl ester carboxylesterase